MELPPKKGYHRHHKVPKFLGGTDEASNLVYLTPYEHAMEHKKLFEIHNRKEDAGACLLYTSPSPRDVEESRMPSSA